VADSGDDQDSTSQLGGLCPRSTGDRTARGKSANDILINYSSGANMLSSSSSLLSSTSFFSSVEVYNEHTRKSLALTNCDCSFLHLGLLWCSRKWVYLPVIYSVTTIRTCINFESRQRCIEKTTPQKRLVVPFFRQGELNGRVIGEVRRRIQPSVLTSCTCTSR